MSFLNSLMPISLVFELICIVLSYYFKDSRVFFIALMLFLSHFIYLFTPLYQAHLFVSLFVPLIFVLFVVMRRGILVFERRNLNKVALLFFGALLSFILSKTTTFNASLQERLFEMPFFQPFSDMSFVFFLAECVFLALWGFLKGEFYFLVGFVLAFVQFLCADFAKASFFEFASLFFVLYLIYHSYKSLYFDTLTRLPNQKALKRRLLGLENVILGAAKFSLNLAPKNEKKLWRKIAKSLKTQAPEAFFVDGNFVFIFSSENEARSTLDTIKRGFESISLKNDSFHFNITTTFFKTKPNFEDDLSTLQELLDKDLPR